jgi:chaperone BCS1
LLKAAQQPAWGRSREFDITTRSANRHTTPCAGDVEDEEECDAGALGQRRKRKVNFTPSIGTCAWPVAAGHAQLPQ